MKEYFSKLIIVFVLLSSCQNKYPTQLGDHYLIDYDGNGYLFIGNKQNSVIIKSSIVGYNYDSKFIVAEQKPIEFILRNTDNSNYDLKMREKILEQSQIKFFWIIDKRNSNVLGPLLQSDYFRKRKELRISDKLTIKSD